jgi:hypothetical protein
MGPLTRNVTLGHHLSTLPLQLLQVLVKGVNRMELLTMVGSSWA